MSINIDNIKTILEKQAALLEQFAPVYEKNGFGFLTDHYDRKKDSYQFRFLLNDRYSNFMQELGELVDAIETNNTAEILNESSDILHFLAEFTLICRDTESYKTKPIKINIPKHHYGNMANYIWNIVSSFGKLMDLMKDKPWVQTPVEVNWDNVYNQLDQVWSSVIHLLDKIGHADLLKTYEAKHPVNYKRIEEGR